MTKRLCRRGLAMPTTLAKILECWPESRPIRENTWSLMEASWSARARGPTPSNLVMSC
jgi:hypothetical protein